MRRRYKQFARKTYRYLRNPRRRRENRLFGWLGERVLNRDLWRPECHAIATGIAIGLVVAMLPPIPIQMVIAAIVAVFLRANIPISAAACWFSNPVTWGPIIWWQIRIGDWLLPKAEGMTAGVHELRCWALGAVLLAVVLAPLGYALAMGIWHIILWMARRSVPVVAPVIASVKKGDGKKEESPPPFTSAADP